MQPIEDTREIAVVMTTCPDVSTAQQIAEMAIGEKLAACVQRVTGVQSLYMWEGKLQEEAEVLLMIKTLPHAVPVLTQRIRAVHPYEIPELLIQTAESGNEAYLQWVRTHVFEPSACP